MIRSYTWICISSAFLIVLAKGSYPTDTEWKYMQQNWHQCCKKHKCIQRSCYIVEWAISGWATVRQRCQSRYSEWPHNIDIFQIRNENDIREFWDMLQNPVIPLKEYPTSIWTSGVRCPRTNSNETAMKTRWISTKEPFPAWLDEKINETFANETNNSQGCEFLVISPAPNNTDVKYNFQDQNAHHATICEFVFPDGNFITDVDSTRESTMYTYTSTETTDVDETTPIINFSTQMPLTPKVKKWQYEWDECCKINTCIYRSCYIFEREPANWTTVSNRCQAYYPDWPGNVNVFRIQNETDIEIFWRIFQELNVTVKEIQRTVWTSGSRCPRTNSTDTILETKWISTEEPFPAWLNERLNETLPDASKDSNRCEFLVISLAPNNTDVNYDFQEEANHHPAICEFTFPEEKLTTNSVTEQDEPKLPTVSTTSTTQSTTKTSFTPSVKTTAPREKKTQSHSSEETTSSTEWPSTTSSPIKYCNETAESGIIWPNTEAGKLAQAKCPDGMIGTAYWYCDEKLLTFQPARPNVENCVHEWIDKLNKSILAEDDVVKISSNLAEETEKNMSHGDITALVNLTSSLLQLYIKQKGEEEFEGAESEEARTYYDFTKKMITSFSNILRSDVKDAWECLNVTHQTREASTILKLVTTIGTRLSCIKKSDEKLQLTVSEKNIDLQTFILNNTDDVNDVIVFPEKNEIVKSNSSIRLPANLKLNKWLSPCKNFNAGVGVIYKQVGDFLKPGPINDTSEVASNVLSFSLSNSTESISLSGGKVNITLKHLSEESVRHRNLRCVFWNFSKSPFGAWDDAGCMLLSSNESYSECQCDHLTNIAVLTDVGNIIEDDGILKMMTYVCCGLSSLTLVLTLICFLFIRSLHGRRSIITGNLSFALLVTNMLIIFGMDETENKILCSVVAGFLHYWILSAFCWMLVEGYHLYRMVILVFQRGPNLPVKFYYIFAYGVPLLIVGISAGVRKEGYKIDDKDKYCWLSPEKNMRWSFAGPASIIILVNIVIFILTLRSASSVKIKREQSSIKKIKSWIRGSISVMCLLGLTWSLGFFYFHKKLYFLSYISAILNGLQGVFIFLFHIVLNDKVNSLCSCSSTDKNKFRRRKFLNHMSCNQTNSKTSTRTSSNSLGCTSSTKLPDSRKQSALSILRNCHPSHGETAVINRNNSNRNGHVLHPEIEIGRRQQASPF